METQHKNEKISKSIYSAPHPLWDELEFDGNTNDISPGFEKELINSNNNQAGVINTAMEKEMSFYTNDLPGPQVNDNNIQDHAGTNKPG